MFCVIKHPDVAVPGTCAESALEQLRARGWFRVSDWRAAPTDFHFADFADATADLDAETAEPDAEPEPDAESAEAPRRSRTPKESK